MDLNKLPLQKGWDNNIIVTIVLLIVNSSSDGPNHQSIYEEIHLHNGP